MITKQLPMKFVPGGGRYEPELPVFNKPMKPVKLNLKNFFNGWWFMAFIIFLFVLLLIGILYMVNN